MRKFECVNRDDWGDLTAARRLWCLLNEAEAEGVHSWDAERLIFSRNSPQRAKDIASKGIAIYKVTERRNGKAGVRWFLDGWQPDHAFPVLPNHANGVDGGDGCDSSLAPPAVAPVDAVRSCRRCDGTGSLGTISCPACFGDGTISARRVNSFQVAA